MFAVKGIYDGKFITTEDPVPVAEKYAVPITFLYPVEKQQSENVEENLWVECFSNPAKPTGTHFVY